MPEKIVSTPTQDKTPKPEKKEKPDIADEPLHAEEAKGKEPVTEFKAKLNKYGFIHVPKKALPSLPFEAEKPLKAKIESDTLIITRA